MAECQAVYPPLAAMPDLKSEIRNLQSAISVGEGGGARTRDPQLKRLLLYQLSYAPTRKQGILAADRTLCNPWPRISAPRVWPHFVAGRT